MEPVSLRLGLSGYIVKPQSGPSTMFYKLGIHKPENPQTHFKVMQSCTSSRLCEKLMKLSDFVENRVMAVKICKT